MNAIPYGVHPPLDQWQVRLDGLFESLCTTNNGSEEVRRSKILMKSLKDADWRKLDISTNEETTRKDQTPAGDSSNGRLPYILYTSRGNVDDMVPSIQLEPPSSPEFMNPVGHSHSRNYFVTHFCHNAKITSSPSMILWILMHLAWSHFLASA